MTELTPSDLHSVKTALLLLDLAKLDAAAGELNHVSEAGRSHRTVLLARWKIAAAAEQWQTGCAIAQTLTNVAPDRAAHWFLLGLSLIREEPPEKAYATLSRVVSSFPRDVGIRMVLAVACNMLGYEDEASTWLHLAGGASTSVKALESIMSSDSFAWN